MNDAFAVNRTLRTLGYHSKWLEYGFIDAAFLRQQFQFYEISSDKSPEHYRYAAFNVALDRHQPFDDASLAQYVELAELDPDKVMANAALADLLQWPGVSPSQFLRLMSQPVFADASLQKIAGREKRRRELK